MNGEQLRQKTSVGGIVYGTMISMGRNPRWTQTISAFGLDYVIIDTEPVSYTHLTLPTKA